MLLLLLLAAQYEIATKAWGCATAAAVGEKDEVMLISEEIKSLALAVIELCLSEGISK